MRDNEEEQEKTTTPDSDIMEAAFEDEYITDIEEDLIIISSDDYEMNEDDMSLDIAFNDDEESLF